MLRRACGRKASIRHRTISVSVSVISDVSKNSGLKILLECISAGFLLLVRCEGIGNSEIIKYALASLAL
jgi:hypothetical protein